MNRIEYQKHFSEHRQGYTSTVYILTSPVLPLTDPPLSEEGLADFRLFNQLAKKNLTTLVAIIGSVARYKGLLVAAVSYIQQRPLWQIDTKELLQRDIFSPGQIGRLFAEAEKQNAILLFDEADSLFEQPSANLQQNFEQSKTLLIEQTRNYKGLMLFSISTDPGVSSLINYKIKLDY